jgi:hypothetical protein
VAETELDWDERRLCVDDACIGVIGADGHCKECGKLAPDAPVASLGRERQVAIVDDDGDDMPDDAAAATGDSADAAFDEDRELCSDDACIGVIGANGRCNECGKPRAA